MGQRVKGDMSQVMVGAKMHAGTFRHFLMSLLLVFEMLQHQFHVQKHQIL